MADKELKDKTLKCVGCGTEFLWSVREQEFFRQKKLMNEPKRCSPCRKKKQERYGQRPPTQPPIAQNEDHLLGHDE